MIGRGVMGNPWIFRGIRQLLNGEPVQPVTLSERAEIIRMHSNAMRSHLPEHIAVREMRKHIGWYIHGLRGAAAVRARINRCNDPDETERILEEFFAGLNE
jgi:tRNA-dihydrouridine synthase B